MTETYPITAAQTTDINNRFTYHPPQINQPERYTYLRELGGSLAFAIMAQTPPSREQALALTKLEEAIFWANASIARHDSKGG